MAKKVEEIEEEDPIVKLENRIFILENAVAKHLGYHFGGIKPD